VFAWEEEMMEMKSDAVVLHQPNELAQTVDIFSQGLVKYLDVLGLPAERVLVPVRERGVVLQNLPSVLDNIPTGLRKDSLYISKFVAACGAGLFDAALNFVWDETVLSLRLKVVQFDLEYFFNSVVTDPDRRKSFNAEKDLENLDDWELIRGCHMTGILSDIGFRHLDYIRNMRNWASAAHPNQNELTGLQIVSWLETCIREVIGKEPSASAIEVKRLLENLRRNAICASDATPINASIQLLPVDLATSLLRTIFGMFADPEVAVQVKSNIRLIAAAVWKRAPDMAKQESGVKYVNYASNADIPRRDSAKEFLTFVNGLTYLPKDRLALEVSDSVASLFQAHIGWNNFHNEPAHAKNLIRYIPENGDVPESSRYEYVKTVTMCYIGNGYGESLLAYPYYQTMISRFREQEIWLVANLVADNDVSSRLQFESCQKRFRKLISDLYERVANEVVKAVLSFLMGQTEQQLPKCASTTEYRKLTSR